MTIPFLSVFLAFLLIYVPRLFVAVAMAKRPEGYDNAHPRDQQAKLDGAARRAAAAHANSFEAFAPFAASVVVCHLAGGNPGTAAILAITHVVARAAYIAAYIGNVHAIRSTVWMIGLGSTTGLFILPWLR